MTLSLESQPSKTSLLPFAENIFSPLDNGFGLIGTYCESCKKYYFPGIERCANCLGYAIQTMLGSRGVIYSFTVVRTKPPFGLPQPYAVAHIDLDGVPLRIFGLLDPRQVGEFRIGASVCLAVGPMGISVAAQSCLRPFFRQLNPPAGS